MLNLCTIGSKPMALGTCLFALDHRSKVKVTYPFYEKTRFDVDEEPGKIWRYGIVFWTKINDGLVYNAGPSLFS